MQVRFRYLDSLASLSVLRRAHDHHRQLRARLNAMSLADRSNDLDQNRHLMTSPTLRSRKLVCSISWFPTGRDAACSNIQIAHQYVQQSSSFKARHHSPRREIAAFQAVATLSRPPAPSSAALKSP